jgi:hypothetical protein
MIERRLLWTFRIRGDATTYLHMPQGPALHHVGGESIWKALLTQTEFTAVLTKLSSQKLQVECFRQSRQDILSQQLPDGSLESSLSVEDTVYLTPQCSLCFYFDPLGEHRCGLEDWSSEMRQAAQKVPKAVEDLDKCKRNIK